MGCHCYQEAAGWGEEGDKGQSVKGGVITRATQRGLPHKPGLGAAGDQLEAG